MRLNKLSKILWCALSIHCGNLFCAAASGFSIYDLQLAAHIQKNGCATVFDACNIAYNLRVFNNKNSDMFAIAYDRANNAFVGMPFR